MILEVLRSVTDFLSGSATSSVNLLIPSLSLDAGDAPPPLLVTITDETRDPTAALGYLPETRPCLAVSLTHEPVSLDPEITLSGQRNGHVSIVIRYGADSSHKANAVRDSYYTLRAVEQSVRAYNANDNAASRARNNVQIIQCTDLRLLPATTAADSKDTVAGILATFECRDITP